MGQAKIKSRNLKVEKYANKCCIPKDVARRRVRAFEIASQKYHRASKCPDCKKRTLEIDSTDFEYTINESWISCTECGYESDITKKYEPLASFYGFDIVKAMCDEREKEFGDGWINFVLNDTEELEKEIGVYKNR